jgi:hypothetical protein
MRNAGGGHAREDAIIPSSLLEDDVCDSDDDDHDEQLPTTLFATRQPTTVRYAPYSRRAPSLSASDSEESRPGGGDRRQQQHHQPRRRRPPPSPPPPPEETGEPEIETRLEYDTGLTEFAEAQLNGLDPDPDRVTGRNRTMDPSWTMLTPAERRVKLEEEQEKRQSKFLYTGIYAPWNMFNPMTDPNIRRAWPGKFERFQNQLQNVVRMHSQLSTAVMNVFLAWEESFGTVPAPLPAWRPLSISRYLLTLPKFRVMQLRQKQDSLRRAMEINALTSRATGSPVRLDMNAIKHLMKSFEDELRTLTTTQ